MFNKKGLSLTEVIIMVAVIAILATAALTSYFGSTKTFNFLADYKKVLTTLRTARNYAITNKQFEGEEAAVNYGVYIYLLPTAPGSGEVATGEKLSIKTFLDNFEPGKYNSSEDYEISASSFTLPEGYELNLKSAADSQYPLNNKPYTFLYKAGSGDQLNILTTSGGGRSPISETTLSKAEHPTLFLELKKDDLSKQIVIFYVSGLAEEYKSEFEL